MRGKLPELRSQVMWPYVRMRRLVRSSSCHVWTSAHLSEGDRSNRQWQILKSLAKVPQNFRSSAAFFPRSRPVVFGSPSRASSHRRAARLMTVAPKGPLAANTVRQQKEHFRLAASVLIKGGVAVAGKF